MMKRSLAYKICYRKKRYSRRVAQRVAQHVNDRGGRQVREYRCFLGRHWHIGGVGQEVLSDVPGGLDPPAPADRLQGIGRPDYISEHRILEEKL